MLSIYIFTGTYDLASGTMKSVQEQYISSAATTTTTTKTRKERFYIVRTEEGISIEESFIE